VEATPTGPHALKLFAMVGAHPTTSRNSSPSTATATTASITICHPRRR